MFKMWLFNFFYKKLEWNCDFNNCSSLKYKYDEAFSPTTFYHRFTPYNERIYAKTFDYYSFYNLNNESFLFTHEYDILTNNIIYFTTFLMSLNTYFSPVGQYNDLIVYFSRIIGEHVRLTFNISQCIYIDSYIHNALSTLKGYKNPYQFNSFPNYLGHTLKIFDDNFSVLKELESQKKIFLWQKSYHVGGSIPDCKLYLNSNLGFQAINELINQHWSNIDADDKLTVLLKSNSINSPIKFDCEFPHKHYSNNFNFANGLVLCMGLVSTAVILYTNY